MWETFLTGFAYLNLGLTILVVYLALPVVLIYLGIVHLSKWCIKPIRKRGTK